MADINFMPYLLPLQDVNDVTPQFPEIMYNATISENFLEGSTVINVVANDTDSGNNGRLRYSITVLTAGGENLFRVDENTGTIFSAGTFDRESFAGPYTIEVSIAHFTLFEVISFRYILVHTLLQMLARDSGTPTARTGTTTVFVRIEDVNDNDPVFELGKQ